MADPFPGLVVKAQSGFFTVRTDEGDLVCRLRGRLKKERSDSDLIAVGDRVTVSRNQDGTGAVEEVLPRLRALSRRTAVADRSRPGARRREQVIVANPDQAVFVFACAAPEPHLRMLDRFLVAAERDHIPAVICANKADLVKPGFAQRVFAAYPPIGYPLVVASAHTGEGIPELQRILTGKLTVLSGPSGVGKSSLLNAVQPGLGLRVRAVSDAHSKGRHTTVAPELVALPEGGYVADTPGLRAIAFWDIEPEELDAYFPEIKPFVEHCAYNDCIHERTPGCAVERGVAEGRVSPERYESFLRLRRGES